MSPARAQRFTVGGAKLTVAEIQERTGLSRFGVYHRLARGVRGAGLLAPPKRTKERTFDCGSHGVLTTREAADLAGISRNSLISRHANGVRGEALVAPPVPSGHRKRGQCYRGTSDHVSTTGAQMAAIAMSIARRFPSHPPSVGWLQEHMGMSRATAYRWRRAFLDAMGEA